MKRALLLCLIALPLCTMAQTSLTETTVRGASVKNFPSSIAARVAAVDPNAVYSNITNFSGTSFNNGGATTIGSNTLTRMVADQLTLAGAPPYTITGFRFSVTNNNSVSVTVRPRVRFYTDNAGTPGTAIAAFSLPPISISANSTEVIESGIITPFVVPTQTVWAGVLFDNAAGTTGATAAQLDLIGQGIFNPVDRGTSTDSYFITSTAGDFLNDNPAGTTSNFGGTPPANFGWELVTAIPFPVVIEYFRGARTAAGNSIEWKINCINTTGTTLSLERSSDGRSFKNVYSLNVTAAQCAQPFSFLDKQPGAGVNYYRLKSVDADGKILYSSVVSLLGKQKGFEIVALLPNPVRDNATITMISAGEEKIQVYVTGLNGARVMMKAYSLAPGANQLDINLSYLSKGTYQLTVVASDGEQKTMTLIKQ